MDSESLDKLCINTIRTLSIDAVEKAGSGHPGTPMDAAATVYCLWQRFLRYDPRIPSGQIATGLSFRMVMPR